MKRIGVYFILFMIPFFAQGQKIDGHILEVDSEGNHVPLVGVNVYWLGTTIGAVTSNEGYFEILRPENADKLVVSFVGFQTDTLTILPNQHHVHHSLQSNLSLDEVTIHGNSPGAHFDRLNPIHTQNITGKELQRAACCNLSESFETNASVDVSYTDAVTGAKQIQLLGLAGIYSQIQVENIPALRGLSSTFGLGYVPGSWMESIQVSKGTASVANGYESITGQVNIEYKKPWNEERFFVNGYLNSIGMGEANANVSFEVSPNISSMVLAHVENMDFELDHNNDSFLDHPRVKQYHVMNRWKYQGENMESQVGIRILDEARISGQPKQLSGNQNPFGIDINTNQLEGFGKVGYIFQRPSTSLALIVSAINHQQESVFGTKFYKGNQQSFYSNLIFVTYLGKTFHTIKTGLSFAYDNFNEELSTQVFARNEQVPGVYAEYTYKYFDELTFMAGVRYDHNSVFGGLFTPRLHFRYQPAEQFTVRASAGRGFRSPNVIAENIYLLSSSRNLVFTENIEIEDAWNFGISITQRYQLLERELTINTDFHRTNFNNQLIVDMEQDPNSVYFYNLNGKSFSNSFQVEVSYMPVNRLDVSVAYRLNDVQSTINGELLEKPLVSRYKGFLTTSYSTNGRKWQFDYTVQLNGGGRLPSTELLPEEYRRGETFPAFTTMNAQISRFFKGWDAYIGVENLTSFTQDNPIISPENPYGPFFDASMVWGPLSGRKFYAGFRFSINKN